ncbi:MAG: nucleoside hydrolase [Pirellulales bacterium]|nr:nucleoside hydrolase [Pirellulales bacterium]
MFLIRNPFVLALCCLSITASATVANAADKRPIPIIFDTDMGNDIDDAQALAVIHALESRGECKLLAVTVTKENPYAAAYVDLVNTFYGRGDIPIGTVRNGMTPKPGRYVKAVATAKDNGKQRYPHDLTSGADAPEATGLLRKTLAAARDGSVVVIQVGFSTNLARLLDTKGDEYSPLDGKSLVKKKVRLLSIMAGVFEPKRMAKRDKEYNIRIDIPTAKKVLEQWPTPIVISGHEIGQAILYPVASILNDYGYVKHHPIREGYELYLKMPYSRPTYDLTSVLYAIRPDRGYFGLSKPCDLVVEEDGFVRVDENPQGRCRYLTVDHDQIIRVKEVLAALSSQPPQKKK